MSTIDRNKKNYSDYDFGVVHWFGRCSWTFYIKFVCNNKFLTKVTFLSKLSLLNEIWSK